VEVEVVDTAFTQRLALDLGKAMYCLEAEVLTWANATVPEACSVPSRLKTAVMSE